MTSPASDAEPTSTPPEPAATSGESSTVASDPAASADSAPTATDPATSTQTPDESTAPKSALQRVLAGFRDGSVQGPWNEPWIEAEREIYQNGGFLQAMAIRIMTWVLFMLFSLANFWWHIAAMFFLGAALQKFGFFTPARIAWHRRFVLLGALVGLPLAIAVAFSREILPEGVAQAVFQGLGLMTAGPMVALMYIGLVTLAVHHGVAAGVTRAVANVGRMAMTNYLTQTLIATSIFYWYGLGLFDKVSAPACMAIVVGIYLAQVAFSTFWLKHFRFGPMEWLWRAFTYMRLEPMRRLANAPNGE